MNAPRSSALAVTTRQRRHESRSIGERQLESRMGAFAKLDRRGPTRRSQWRSRRRWPERSMRKTIELSASRSTRLHPHVRTGVRRHIQRALKAGATKEEITAVLQLATPARSAQHVHRAPDPARGTGRDRAREG
jgi:hypothetical protein